jgi:hypothetical protein
MTRFSNPWGLQVICMRPDRGVPPLLPGGCDIIDLRITCALRLSIHTWIRMSLFLSGFHDGLLSWGSLSGVWMLRRCSRDAQILAAGAATLRPSRRTGLTDGLRDGTLPASSELSWSHGKREKENSPHAPPLLWGESRNGVILWGIFAFWRNNHNTN